MSSYYAVVVLALCLVSAFFGATFGIATLVTSGFSDDEIYGGNRTSFPIDFVVVPIRVGHFLGIAVCWPLHNKLVDVVGVKVTTCISILWASLNLILTPLAIETHWSLLLLLRIMIGVEIAMFLPSLYVTQQVWGQHEGLKRADFLGFLAFFFGIFLVHCTGISTSFENVCIHWSVIGFIVVQIWLIIYSNDPDNSCWIQIIPEAEESFHKYAAVRTNKTVGSNLRRPSTPRTLLVTFIYSVVLAGLISINGTGLNTSFSAGTFTPLVLLVGFLIGEPVATKLDENKIHAKLSAIVKLGVWSVTVACLISSTFCEEPTQSLLFLASCFMFAFGSGSTVLRAISEFSTTHWGVHVVILGATVAEAGISILELWTLYHVCSYIVSAAVALLLAETLLKIVK